MNPRTPINHSPARAAAAPGQRLHDFVLRQGRERDRQVDPWSSFSNFGKPRSTMPSRDRAFRRPTRAAAMRRCREPRWRRLTSPASCWQGARQDTGGTVDRAIRTAMPTRSGRSQVIIGRRSVGRRPDFRQPQPHDLDLGAVVHDDLEARCFGRAAAASSSITPNCIQTALAPVAIAWSTIGRNFRAAPENVDHVDRLANLA